jgi:peptidoglycan/LPS O-acetylase OafA/YrhL
MVAGPLRPDNGCMTNNEKTPDEQDIGTPTLLLVAAASVVVAVVAVVIVGATDTVYAGVLALAVVLAGLVAVTATMSRQLGQSGEPVRQRRRPTQ